MLIPRLPISLLLLSTVMVCLHAAGHPKVPHPPQMKEHPEKEYGFRPGSSELRLICRATGFPEPTYEWYKDGVRVTMGGRITMQLGEGTINIKKPTEKHKGLYQCFARNEYGVAVSTKALVRESFIEPFPPSSPTPKVNKPVVGSELTLKCSPPKSYPEGDVYWNVGGSDRDTATRTRVQLDSRVTMDYDGNLHFANVKYNDTVGPDMFYICTIFNGDLGGTMEGDPEAVLIEASDVPATPPFIAPELQWSSKNPTVAIKGKDHKMKCIFSGFPTPKVSWSKVDERGNKVEMPANHEVDETGLELVLNNVQLEDHGFYKCEAVTQNMPNAVPVSQNIRLDVEAAPEFIGDMYDVTRSVEEDAEFECQASGVPGPIITWTVDGKVLSETNDNPRRTIQGGKVRYTNLTKLDTEVLQCNASNKHGYAFKNVYLNVLAEPPSFIKAPESVSKVAEGQTLDLACQVFGHPRPTITWWFTPTSGGEEQEVNDPRMSIRPDVGTTYGGNLTITNVKKSDEGKYKCKAKNRYDEIEHTGRLVVREKTRITTFPQDKTVNASEDVELKCNASTDPHEAIHLTITWLKNGKEIEYQNEPRISKNNQNHSLIIKGATVEDTSEYTCVAGNGLDRDEQTVSVTVKDRPDPPENVRLASCTSNAELEWEAGNSNNEELIEFIIYYNTSFDESGVFHKVKTVGRDVTRTKITLSPWANYTFHVIARNRLGTSDKSNYTPSKCTTTENIPYKNPENVCTESRGQSQLVITWDIMEKIDHNGEGFYYKVSWNRLDVTNSGPESEKITDWQQSEYVVEGQETFKMYEISVQALNNQGPSPSGQLESYVGYSGEGKPRDSPKNFAYDEESLNATSVLFTWDPVDESPEKIQGHFIGYEVVYWREEAPEDKRTHLVVLNNAVHCKPIDELRRRRRQVNRDEPAAHVLDLWPYSSIEAGVSVRNSKSSGELSPTISFTTPEGVPSILPMFEVRERGSHHLGVVWAPPITPNGIIISYRIRYQKLEDPSAPMEQKDILDPLKRSTKIKGLEDSTGYRLFISAETGAGYGLEYITESATLEAGSPDKPGFADVDVGESSVNVSWIPTDDELTPKNPGSEFFVEYRKKDSSDDWNRSDPLDEDHHWTNISGLDFGDEYELVIVAVNGAGQETRSDVKTISVGAQAEKENTAEPSTMGLARAGWFVGMMCAIAFLLLVLIIVCLIKRNRGGKYPVHEKEKLRGRDPDRDDEERGFGEYTKTDEPDYTRSAGSLESESKPLGESDTDSMAEYEDTDPSKFNEDGSFIGQYGGKKKSKDKIEPDATSPSALSTFV